MPRKSPKRQPAKKAAAKATPKRGTRARKVATSDRRQAILDAALLEFSERGFEATRLDDVAKRCGVAKGTLYLYFKDKENLFEDVVRGAATPILANVRALADQPDLPFDKVLAGLFAVFEKEILGTQRKLLLRLVIAEGPRFPRIAKFYFDTIISQVMPLLSHMAERAAARGETSSRDLVRYPQLIAAPLLLSIIWDGMFASLKPLDVDGLLRAHRELLTAGGKRGRS